MKKYQLLAAVFCSLTTPAHAAEEPILDEIVITATRIEHPLKQTLSSTTLLTQEDIKNSQASDVPAILRTVAGVEISQSGGSGKSSSLYLRGNESTQVLVLLDGVRMNTATGGTASIEHLMLDQIERIEIVRGNVSSLYGSEAIGGVVQIFTKRGRGKPVFNFSAGAGNHGTQRAAAGFGGKIENTDFNLQVSRLRTDGISAINPETAPVTTYSKANPDNDGYENSSISANARHAFNNDHSLTATAFNSTGQNQYDSTAGVATDVNKSDSQIRKYSLASDNRLNDIWQSKLQLAQGTDIYQDYKNGIPVVDSSTSLPSSKFQTDNTQLSWENMIHLDDGKQLLVGAEYLKQHVSTDRQPAYIQNERKVNSMFVGYTGKYGVHQLQTNLRQDNNSQYGIANTGLLGYGFEISDAWRATASYSTAFRAPTLNNLYYVSNFYNGNASLRPEQSRNKEVGLHYSFDKQNVDIVYFDNFTNDLIVYVASTSGPQNVNEARIDGLEFSYTGQFDSTNVKSAVTIQNPRNITSNKALDRRSVTHSNVAVTHQLDALQIGGEWLYSDTRPDGTKILSSYHVFNLTAAYTLNKQWKASMRADNITDQNDSNAYGYNPLGRTFFASLSYQQ